MQLFKLMAIVVFGLAVAVAQAAVPSGYPADYQKVVDAAVREGKLIIYSTTDTKYVSALLKDFQASYPGIHVEYNDVNSTELYNRYVSETAAGSSSADVLWSSAMDLQVKLVNDGYALTYQSPEIANLPEWAHWRNEAYGTTFEPIVFVYNKRLVDEKDVPKTHTDLINLLKTKADKFQGKVTSYDPEKSGLGFMLVTQDSKLNPGIWDFVRVLGQRDVKLQSSTGTMMERISSGENLIGYNMLGSYALSKAKKDASLGVVMPKDYTLVISRLMFISKTAKNSNAATLWLNFVLSKRGQTLLAQSDFGAIHKGVEGPGAGAQLSKELGKAAKPVTVGPGLLVYLDQAKRLEFLKQWQQALGRK